ncbi:uncharacterized protein LOC108630516 [Ceratina calcarata]|uniref:Uncharacterized protein LOC108630516 n=1 Tax=Ceratina calcarata TaxID=156304 RepID=A0AAJ7JC87_9HYME|nr:uncharacterized protein LOC108630516 [Ceratina calcarata]
MPYGMTWPKFLSFITLAALAMASGSQCVHVIYKPLDDLDDLIEEAVKKRLSERQDSS